MKRFHLYAASVVLLLFSACSTDNDAFPGNDGGNTPSAALRIEVRADDFTPAGSTTTRATDSGATTTFENGDRIGIIVLDNSNVVYDNIPYKYNGNTWSFDSENGEGKTAIYYDNKATAIHYIAYFPYSKDADGVTGEDALKAEFPPLSDQRTEAAYRTSDLLVWSSKAGNAPLKKLDIAFTHAYSSLSLSPSITCKINGVETSYIPSSVDDVSFTIQGTPHIAYRADDGSYQIIVSPQTTDARWFFSYKSEMHGGTMASTELAKNKRYTVALVLKDIGDYTFEKAQVGDFYCKNDKGEGYLIPGEATSLTMEQQVACLGVVFYVGDIKNDNYGLLDSKFPGGTHGLVVSLWDMPAPDNPSSTTMTWTYGGCEYVNNWLGSKDGVTCTWEGRPTSFTSIQETEKMQGYANTVALAEYNKYVEDSNNNKNQNLCVKPAKGLAAFQSDHPAPESSSGWYWPSIYELKQVCWGQGVTIQGANGKNMLNTQIGKVGSGTTFGDDDFYWSSTEHSRYSHYAWYVYFYSGFSYYGDKYYYTCRVRPLFAF